MQANARCRRLWRGLLFAGSAGIVAVGTPTCPETARELRHPAAELSRFGADQMCARVASAALVVLAAWVAIGLAASMLAALPGTAGRVCDRLARLVLPAALYRIAVGAAGVGLVLAPVVDAHAADRPTSGVSMAAADAGDPAPAWPSDAPLRAPAWPTSAAAGQPARPIHHRSVTDAGRLPSAPRTARQAPATVVVQPGDSLWSIAADQLPHPARPAAIAREWPRWYGANRAVIGPDPDLLHPGQVLTRPPVSKELP